MRTNPSKPQFRVWRSRMHSGRNRLVPIPRTTTDGMSKIPRVRRRFRSVLPITSRMPQTNGLLPDIPEPDGVRGWFTRQDFRRTPWIH